MAKIIPMTEHFQHFPAEMTESFWGDLYGQTRQAWQRFFELLSERQRDQFSGWGALRAHIFRQTDPARVAFTSSGFSQFHIAAQEEASEKGRAV